MKKFEIAGIEYKYNTETGRYSKTENGKTKRIGKAEYEEAASKPVGTKTIPSANLGNDKFLSAQSIRVDKKSAAPAASGTVSKEFEVL